MSEKADFESLYDSEYTDWSDSYLVCIFHLLIFDLY